MKYELINYCEFDKYATKAYSLIHNEPESKNLGDITKINEKEIADFNMMTWGFCCQDISSAGKQKGIKLQCNDCKKEFMIYEVDDYNCPACESENIKAITESGLYYNGYKILKEKKPLISIIENVKALTTKPFKLTFEKILNDLNKAGYNNYWKIINAIDCGIPQNRERVFIISIRKDVDNHRFKFPQKIDLNSTLRANRSGLKVIEILESDAELPILHNIYGGFKEKKPRIFNEYSPTIRTAKGGGHIPSVCTNNPEKIEKIINQYNTRLLTTLESFRLMGFEDRDHDILVENGIKKTQLYKQAGNSIVVDVLYYILLEIYKAMPYLLEDIKLSSFFSGIGAFEKAIVRLRETISN